jgi:hypothetical protein
MMLVLEIGGMAIGVKHDSPEWDAVLRGSCAGFVSDKKPAFVVNATVVKGFKTVHQNGVAVLSPKPGGVYSMEWHDLEGTFDPDGGTCTVTLADNVGSINSVLRNVVGVLFLRSHGLALHAASFTRGGRAFIFPGVSTAGKSTLSMITLANRPECELLTDELSLVRRIGGRWLAFGSPFWGSASINGKNGSSPVEKICFIEKSSVHRLKPLKKADAYARLVQNAAQAVYERRNMAAAMKTAAEIVEDVPAFVLKFRLDAGFWELL